MTLREWMEKNGITAYRFAQMMGLEHSRTVYRYVTGERRPNDDAIRKIAALTSSAVTANDWIHTPPNNGKSK